MINIPKVSIIMPVFNREQYVADAIRSILNQTFTDFEFIIIDDGSTDSTFGILKSFMDKRIRLIRKNENNGNYAARNIGMHIAKGKYICVMDSDDIALPHRILVQYNFMEDNIQFGICGGHVQIMNSNIEITAPEDYDEIKVWLMSNIMLRHPTVFIRNEFLKKYNLNYDDSYRYAGDYDFLVKAAHLFPVTNIQEVLLQYRRHPEQISTAHKSGQFEVVNKVILKQLRLLNGNSTRDEERLHLALMNRFPVKEESEFEKLKQWANHLLQLNDKKSIYDSSHLANFLKSLLKFVFKQYQISLQQNKKFSSEIENINQLLNPTLPLVYQKEWTVLPDFTLNLIGIITESLPAVVVECGSGLSTLVLGYLVKKGLIKNCFSLEHNKQFYDLTKAELQKHKLSEFVDLIYAPLVSVEINNGIWQWYDTSQIESDIEIDMLIVDGPPGQIQKHSRYPALLLLNHSLHKNTTIIVDDSNRTEEKEIINRWILENPELRVKNLNTVKGMSVLKYS